MEDFLRLCQNLILFVFVVGIPLAFAQVSVTTYHNDNSRTGQNTQETVLTTAKVSYNTFGKLFAIPVDGQVYAQPLVLGNVSIGGGTHNVVYVATENDSVYALDANNGTVYWQKNFVPAGLTPSDDYCNGSGGNIVPKIGITGTPVIDTTTNTIYFVTSTKQAGVAYYEKLHALNVSTGAEKFGGPVLISASYGGAVFDPERQLNRPGLLLQNSHVVIAFGQHCSHTGFGWVISYNKTTLAQEAVFNTAPGFTSTYGDATIWMSGNGVTADSNGNMFFATGDGPVTAGQPWYGDSILKLGAPLNGTMSLLSYFIPWNYADLYNRDLDLGSGGVLLLPDLPVGSAHQHLLVQAGKDGAIHLVDRDHMGGLCNTCNSTTGDKNIVQELSALVGLWGSPAYWNGTVYFGSATDQPSNVPDVLKAFSFNAGGSGLLSSAPTSHTGNAFTQPAPTPSVSSNGISNGIVWALDNSSYQAGCTNTSGCSVLHAYDATNLQNELYNSSNAPWNADAPGGAIKFSVPTIANGNVYVGTQNSLTAYGLTSRLPQANQPFFVPPPQTFMTLTVNAQDGTPGAVFHCLVSQYTQVSATPTSPVCTNPIVSNWSGKDAYSQRSPPPLATLLALLFPPRTAGATAALHFPPSSTKVISKALEQNREQYRIRSRGDHN